MKNIAIALCKAKTTFGPITKDRVNPHFKNKYATLDSVLDAINKSLCDNGLVLIQPTEIVNDVVVLKTILIHAESGETLESVLPIPTQSDPQKLGSVITYYRRYGICGLLAITADEDGDGNSNSNGNRLSSEQAKRVDFFKSLIAKHNLTDNQAGEIVRKNFKSKISEMTDTEFDRLCALVKHQADEYRAEGFELEN